MERRHKVGGGKTERGKAARGHRSPRARLVDRFIHRLAHILAMALLAGTCVTILGGLFLDASALIPVDENGARQAMFESANAHRLLQSNSGGDRTMKYSEIFVGRTDTYARASNGGYQRVGKPLDANVSLLHRLGHISAGIYLIRPEDNTAKLIVLDIDEDEPEGVERLAEQVLKYIPKKAVIIEKTGGRGWHLWLLFNDWVPAGILKRFGEWLVKKADAGVKVEVFPKQARIMEGGFGNLVRLPLGKHPRTGQEGTLFHAGLTPIEMRATGDRDLDLVGIEPCSPKHIPRDAVSDGPKQLPLPTGRQTFREPLPCFDKMLQGVDKGCRDIVGFALAKHLRRQGRSKEEGNALLLDWNSRNRPPLPKSQVLQKIAQAYERDYRGLDCEDPCIQRFCQPGCPLASASRRREWRIWSSGELGRVDIEPVRMVVEGVSLPDGGSLLLAGPPGVGKSWVALGLGICLASGEPLLGEYDVLQRNVLFFDEEGSDSGTKERHDALKRGLGLDPGHDIPLWIAIKTGLRLDRQDDIGRLIQTIQQYEVQVVIFDSLIRLHGGDENSSRDMGLLSRNLNRVQVETGVAMVIIQHTRKGLPGASRRDIVRGSSEITAWPDVIVSCDREFGLHTFHCIKSRYREEFADIGWTLEVDERVARLRIEDMGLTTYEDARKDSARRLVLKLAEDGEWYTLQEFIDRCRATGIGRPTCKGVLRDLVEEGLLEFEQQGPYRKHCYRLKGTNSDH